MIKRYLFLFIFFLNACSSPPAKDVEKSLSENDPVLHAPLPAQSLPKSPESNRTAQSLPSPMTLPSDQTTEEVLSSEVVRLAIEAKRKELTSCFSQNASWVAILHFVVEPSGNILQAALTDELATSILSECVISHIEKIKLPAFRGEALAVRYPFVLKPTITPASYQDILPISLPTSQASSLPTSLPEKQNDMDLFLVERHLALGEVDKAETLLKTYTKNPPNEALYLLGSIASQRGNLKEMCFYYQKYLQLAPTSPAANALRKQMKAISNVEPTCQITD